MSSRSGSKFFNIFLVSAAVLSLAACSSTDEGMMEEQASSTYGAGQDGITSEGPLSEIYDNGAGGADAGTQADLVVNVGDRVFFGYDSYDLSAQSRTTLEKQAQWLSQYGTLTIAI